MNKTPEEARQIVADALRSGEYKQGKQRLETRYELKTTHCCLGVACREFLKYEEPDFEIDESQFSTAFGKRICLMDGSLIPNHTTLPEQVQNWLGFKSPSGVFSKLPEGLPKVVPALTTLNDRGATFDQIAELFENPPEGLLDV